MRLLLDKLALRNGGLAYQFDNVTLTLLLVLIGLSHLRHHVRRHFLLIEMPKMPIPLANQLKELITLQHGGIYQNCCAYLFEGNV
jgi:hypothetical protein